MDVEYGGGSDNGNNSTGGCGGGGAVRRNSLIPAIHKWAQSINREFSCAGGFGGPAVVDVVDYGYDDTHDSDYHRHRNYSNRHDSSRYMIGAINDNAKLVSAKSDYYVNKRRSLDTLVSSSASGGSGDDGGGGGGSTANHDDRDCNNRSPSGVIINNHGDNSNKGTTTKYGAKAKGDLIGDDDDDDEDENDRHRDGRNKGKIKNDQHKSKSKDDGGGTKEAAVTAAAAEEGMLHVYRRRQSLDVNVERAVAMINEHPELDPDFEERDELSPFGTRRDSLLD